MLIAGFAVELPDRWMTTITITLTLMCGATAAAAYGNYHCPLLDIGPKVRRKDRACAICIIIHSRDPRLSFNLVEGLPKIRLPLITIAFLIIL